MAHTRPERILGVDFGTTTCSAGIHDPRGPQLVVDRGEAAIPSAVYFPLRGDPILGAHAIRMLTSEPTNTIRSVKRILGRRIVDPTVVGFGRALHYALTESEHGQLVLGLSSGDVTCEQVVAQIFRTLRDLAERRFACRISQMVATVPAAASEGYEASIRRAARLAHLDIIETLPEPVAGALPMGLHLERRDRRVLVCDFGGGTFDASLIDAGFRRLDVIATHGDDFLGGDDFDEELMEAVASVVFSRSSFDMLRDAVLRQRLLLRCEQAKRGLSSHSEVRLRVTDAYRHEGRPCSIDSILDRAWVEPKWTKLVDRAALVVEQLLAGVGMTPRDVDEVALIGGTCLIPMVRRRLAEMFKRGVMVQGVGAATAVVEGAILRCAAYETQLARAIAPPLVASGA